MSYTKEPNNPCGVAANNQESEMILKKLKELNASLYEVSLKVNRHKKKLFGDNPTQCGSLDECEKTPSPNGFVESFYFEAGATAAIINDLFKDLAVIEKW